MYLLKKLRGNSVCIRVGSLNVRHNSRRNTGLIPPPSPRQGQRVRWVPRSCHEKSHASLPSRCGWWVGRASSAFMARAWLQLPRGGSRGSTNTIQYMTSARTLASNRPIEGRRLLNLRPPPPTSLRLRRCHRRRRRRRHIVAVTNNTLIPSIRSPHAFIVTAATAIMDLARPRIYRTQIVERDILIAPYPPTGYRAYILLYQVYTTQILCVHDPVA